MSDVYHRGTESQRETFNLPDAGRLERKPFNPTRVVTGREPRSQDRILSVASGSILNQHGPTWHAACKDGPHLRFLDCQLSGSVTPWLICGRLAPAGSSHCTMTQSGS